MRSDSVDLPVFHHDDLIGVLNAGYPLCDDDRRHSVQIFFQPFSDKRVGFGIDRAGGIVEDQHFRFLQQRTGDAEPLTLTAADIGAALFDERIVLLLKPLDKGIRLSDSASLDDLLVARILISPAQILFDRSAEKNVLLQDHRHAVSQRLDVVFPDRMTAEKHFAFARIVKTRNQVDQRRFAGTGSADDADRFAFFYGQIDRGQGVFFRGFPIFERNVFEFDVPATDLVKRILRIDDRRLFHQNLVDPVDRRNRHDQEEKNHRNGHQGGKNLRAVRNQRRNSSDVQIPVNNRIAVDYRRVDDVLRPHKEEKNHRNVHRTLNDRIRRVQHLLDYAKSFGHLITRFVKFFFFVFFFGIGLDDAHAADILFDRLVQIIVHPKQPIEFLAR